MAETSPDLPVSNALKLVVPGLAGSGRAAVATVTSRKKLALADLASRPAVLLAGLALAALLVRLPLIAEVPRFTDETDDMLVTYALSSGQSLPLANFSTYVGVLLTYAVAPFYKLFGPRLEIARLVVALFGVATLLPTYWLGRRLGGPRAGLLAALLLAASAPHIMLNSRVAWSHSITPFFTTLAVVLLLRTVELRHGPTLAASGLLAGLSFQSHPTVLAMLPAGVAYVLVKQRRLLATRWALYGLLAAVLVNANLLYYNLVSNGDSFRMAALAQVRYSKLDTSRGEGLSYQRSMLQLFDDGGRLLGGSITDAFLPAPPLLTPAVVILSALALASLTYCAARGQPLPLMVLIGSVLLFPTFLTRYEPVITNGRYLMPLVPICLAACGAALVALGGKSRLGTGLAVLLLAFALGSQLAGAQTYVSSCLLTGLTNERFYQAEAVLVAAAPAEPVLFDHDLAGDLMGRQFRYIFETHDLPYESVDQLASAPVPAGQSRLVALRTSSLSQFGPNARIEALLPAVEEPRGARFGIYRIEYPVRG